jgi:hypothetical protein
VPGLDVNLPKGAFDADGDFNLLAFIPIETQGSIESFLFVTTGTLLMAFLLAGVRCGCSVACPRLFARDTYARRDNNLSRCASWL